ncbi:nucleotide binding protein [Galdieria sulphuraria]|uniref:GPN-loop GTPase n=1 Tax=Galdieria sulphuraria TaxID=130081 RepID=M2X918_GALSU|nr:nucleotide binding protein [Galdieria sulphuraria]EME26312.1 nucleotide binding protein [Galdieria sulphuraria]|eukprot:XP_005702832.1 nucleotide binding protein [Galdieria sulphuraria]
MTTTHSNTTSTIACLVIGMAGSGKTTLVQRLAAELSTRDLCTYLVNLDPAVIQIPYEPNVDIRDTLNYKDVQVEFQLGPNGAILTALNLFATRIDQLVELLESREEQVDTFVVDTPGQVEVFTWSSSGSIIAESIASSFPTILLYVVDTPRATKPLTFVSNMIYACSIMYRMQLPLVVVLNKKDLVSTEFAQQWLNDFDTFDEAMQQLEGDYSSNLARSMALAMEEFYRVISCCSISAATGEGMDELWNCIQKAAKEFSSFRNEKNHISMKQEAASSEMQSQGASSSQETSRQRIAKKLICQPTEQSKQITQDTFLQRDVETTSLVEQMNEEEEEYQALLNQFSTSWPSSQ